MMNDNYLKEEIQEEEMLNEPSFAFKTGYIRPTPDYVLEDFRIGMEQYEKGEYMDMDEFMEELKERYR